MALEALLARLPEDTEGHAFGGATLEDREVYYVLLGCRTVEVRSCLPFRRCCGTRASLTVRGVCQRDDPEGTGMKIMHALAPLRDDLDRRHVLLMAFEGADPNRDEKLLGNVSRAS